MRLTPVERLLKNLKQEIPPYMRREYLTRETAYEKLKIMTGQDFGFDAVKWESWVQAQEADGVTFRISKEED